MGRIFNTVANNFPDGLSVGPLAAHLNMPILLANEGANIKYASTFTDAHNVRTGIVIGGPTLISDNSAKAVLHNETVVIYEEGMYQ